MKEMNILYLAPEHSIRLNQSGGAGTHIRGTLKHLVKNNRVSIMIGGDILFSGDTLGQSPVHKPSGLKRVVKNLVPKELLRLRADIQRKNYNAQIYKHVNEYIQQNDKPQVIYERSAYGYDVGLRLSKKWGIPLVVESDVLICDFYQNQSSVLYNKWIFRKLERRKLYDAKLLVVMSKGSINAMKKEWGIPRGKIRIKGLGIEVENDKNTDDPQRNESLQFKIGFTGIFQPYHNIKGLIEASMLLQKSPIEVVVVGKDAKGFNYAELANELGANKINFTGLIDHNKMREMYKSFDAGIIPGCATFMYPVKFLEFGLYGIPTIVPSHEAFREFFKSDDQFQKFTFNPNDSKSMARKIIDVQKNFRAYLHEWNPIAARIRENYSWSSCNSRLEKALAEVVINKNEFHD